MSQVEFKLSIGLTTKAGDSLDPDASLAAVSGLLQAAGVDGFAALPGVGVWRGTQERCFTVTWIQDAPRGPALALARTLAAQIASALEQECVLAQCHEVQFEFVQSGR